ncbi:Acylamidase [Sulfitobacter sp. THAF37]|nr:Acylamidase [Sulfitobacter sp. THAF37]
MDARAQSAALAAGDFSAAELMEATLARIAEVNGRVNAVVALRDADSLMAEARAADAAPRKGWLHGIPMAVKDLANVAGLVTTRGSPLFERAVAPKDDPIVSRLRAAGAVIIGKTNTPEFGLGSHTFNPVHGATTNPYDARLSAGGSSGGAAAALAARMLSVADGSDMMGSLRNPAGWNNVYGMRPTWGTVPGEPDRELFLHQLSTLGPMARSPADLSALLDTMTGADPKQPHGQSPADTLPGLFDAPGRLRIGWLGDWGGALPFDAGILPASEVALRRLAGLGHDVTPVAPPFSADAMWDAWITLRSFSVATGLADIYLNPETREALKEAAQWEVGRGLAMDAMTVHRASEVRSDWFRRAADLFDDIDVLVLPSAQVWPFDVTQTYPTEVAGQVMDTYHRWMQVVVPASLIGLPVVNIPAGFGENGLPLGLQLIGARGSDGLLLRLAQQWHAATEWPQARPPVI